MRTDTAVRKILTELSFARQNHPTIHSYHEGYALIKKELDELWVEVTKRHQSKGNIEEEAIQVAAMAIRFLVDLFED